MKKNHEKFSKIFGIVIRPNTEEIINTENSDKHGMYHIHIFNRYILLVSDFTNILFIANLSARSKNLKEHLRDVIQIEIEATDERIRLYNEHQSALLKIFREKAEHDYQDLIR